MATLALTNELWLEITNLLVLPHESAGVLLAGRAEGETLTLLGRFWRPVPEKAYQTRTRFELKIASEGYVPFLGEASDLRAVPIFVHTHPGGQATPSIHDLGVDAKLSELFATRSASGYYVSLIIGGTPLQPTFTGRVVHAERPDAIDRLRIIGQRWQVLSSEALPPGAVDLNLFDRQIRAFGTDGQRLLERLLVGVVGVGGTGSAVSEQLLRLGVGHVTVIDHDSITESNLTRVHEAGLADVGSPKVQVARNMATDLGRPDALEPVIGSVTSQSTAARLRHCDIVFGCTDDQAGRGVLSRLAYWYLIPFIDLGFVISSHDGGITGLFGRITTVMPGTACLLCRDRIDPDAMRNEMLSPDERQRLAREGYAPELNTRDPAVVPFTTLVAAFAVSEFLDRLFGYGDGHPPSELLLRLHDRKISQNNASCRDGHFCENHVYWGRGDTTPLLGQTW